jgi:hypothetical protein
LRSWTRRRGGAVEQRKKTGGSACCRGSRAARRRLQQVRLLFRGGDLTTDGSGLGVGVSGSGCSGFAADMHGTPLLRRPRLQAGQRCGGPAARRWPSATQVGGAAVQAPSPPSLLLHGQRSSGSSTASRPRSTAGPRLLPRLLRLLPPSNSFSPLLIFGGGGGFRGNPQGGGAVQGWLGRLFVGWLLGFEGASEWCRCSSRARGGHPARQRCRGRRPWGWRGAPVASLPHGFVTGKKPARRGKGGERGADRRAPHGSDQEEGLEVDGPAGGVGPKGIGGLVV